MFLYLKEPLTYIGNMAKQTDFINRSVGQHARRLRRKDRIDTAAIVFLILGHIALLALGVWAYFKVLQIEKIIGI